MSGIEVHSLVKFFFYRFDALSHRSSGSSLNVANNLGTVSKTSTPMSGSLENLAGGELLRKAFNNSAGSFFIYTILSFWYFTDWKANCVKIWISFKNHKMIHVLYMACDVIFDFKTSQYFFALEISITSFKAFFSVFFRVWK